MSDGMLSGVRAGLEDGPRDELVCIEQADTRTVFVFDDGSRLEMETGELLRELLTPEIILELVRRVNEFRDEIESAA